MRILITGLAGFAGRHLSKHILDTTPHAELHGTTISQHDVDTAPANLTYRLIDLRDSEAVHDLIAQLRPESIYHLAAQAFVPRSFDDPWETLENNIRAQLNIIQACIALQIKPRMLVVSSAEIYGPVQPHELPLDENAALRPTSPYSVSKVTQDMLALQYYLSHQLPLMRARPFNHIGPGQDERFVAPAFAIQIARIEAGQQPPVIYVGDLTSKRDFTDARDVAAAYRLIVEKGTPGEVYNIASGEGRTIQSLLDILLSYSPIPIDVQADPSRLRPSTIPVLQGNATRLREATGWQPTIPFEQTLADILDDCRQRIRSSVT